MCDVWALCFEMLASGPWSERLRDSLVPLAMPCSRVSKSVLILRRGWSQAAVEVSSAVISGPERPSEGSRTKMEIFLFEIRS